MATVKTTEKLSDRLAEAMRLRGFVSTRGEKRTGQLAVRALARAAQVSAGTISRLLRGESAGAHAETVAKLATALRVDQQWLTSGTGTMLRPSETRKPSPVEIWPNARRVCEARRYPPAFWPCVLVACQVTPTERDIHYWERTLDGLYNWYQTAEAQNAQLDRIAELSRNSGVIRTHKP